MAGGTVDTPVLVIEVQDKFGTSCATPLAGVCIFDFSGDGTPANSTLDLYQRIEYIGVAPDFAIPRGVLGEFWLLPDDDVRINGSSLYVEHPLYHTARARYGDLPIPREPYGLDLNEEEIVLRYYGPYNNFDPTGPRGDRNNTVQFAQRQGVQSDSIGPVNAPTGPRSDDLDLWFMPCVVVKGPCAQTIAPIFNDTKNATPAFTVGLEFYDLQFATDPSNLTYPHAEVVVPGMPAAHIRVSGPAIIEADNATLQAKAANQTGAGGVPAPPRARGNPSADTRPPGVTVLSQAQPPRPPESPVPLILGATAAGIFLVALGAGLYSRFHSRSEVLKSETRDRLVDLIGLNPGILLSDAAAAIGITRNAVQHHVRMLARVGVVRVASEGSRRTLYIVGGKPSDAPPAWLLKNAACAAIVRALQASPDGMPREAVHKLMAELPERTRNYNIRKLLSVGVVEQVETPEGRKVLRARAAPGGG